jgi:hypothetical protein
MRNRNMQTSPTSPLSIAATVLSTETLRATSKAPFTAQGWKILDRWAYNSPEKLRALEAKGLIALLTRLRDQQTWEQDALNSSPLGEGLAEHEILARAEINTEL